MAYDMASKIKILPSVKARSFSLPDEVVDDPSLNADEKRSILSEWASDASAIAGMPTLRLLPGTSFPVTFSSILEARERLDRIVQINCELKETAIDDTARVVVADFARRKQAQHV
jgi:hypothetical protein